MCRILLTLFFLLSFGTLPILHAQYQVNLIRATDATFTVRSVGYAKNRNQALTDAELSAVKAVLFQGIDGTSNPSSLIPFSPEEAEQAHGTFLEKFYAEGYKQFIASTEIVKPFGKDANKRKCIVADVTVKVRALREYLERCGVIRKFGL